LSKVTELKDEGFRLDPIEDVLADLRAGRMVIVMDDEDRENEGDLLMAASLVRAEDINFMARYGRGLICLTLTPERCEQLAPAADGQRHGPGAEHEFHLVHRGRGGRHHRDLGARPRAHHRAAVAPAARPETCASRAISFP
jgi:3,4-dihydroxy 2-butanone 4-phosphate synthase / GTP cyclohydrolase II